MVTRQDFAGRERPTWCPGCGNHGILNAIKFALVELNMGPHELIVVSGIGCGSKLPHYMKINGFHNIHGRALPVATGMRLANHGMKVMCVHGDGDSYAMGLGHFAHAARRNINITDVVQDNRVYGLTQGQYSPTSAEGMVTKSSPEGAIDRAVPPLALAITMGATFVARGYSNELKHLASLIAQGLQHDGYALIDVLQPCVTFNRASSYDYYNPRVYKLEDEGWDPTDKAAAWEKAFEWGDRIPLGVFYRAEAPTYEEQVPALRAGPLVAQPLRLPLAEYEALKDEFV